MGGCLTRDRDGLKARCQSDSVDRYLHRCARHESNVVKILLLGTGESGKSTLVKQMKIIHNGGFASEELQCFKPIVLENLVSSMKYVLQGMGQLRISMERPANVLHAQTVLACEKCYDSETSMLPHIGTALHCLGCDRGVRQAVSRGFEFELNDSTNYYFENMTRICSPLFTPNAKDVLRARVRTIGVIETDFHINNIHFRMFDVGGQRSERKKWVHCFDDVRALLFVVAMSEYDMNVPTDLSMNRLSESLQLFSSICHNRFFHETSVILFLNKIDLFRLKILNTNRQLRHFFPKYMRADYDVESAAMFIQSLFLDQTFYSKNKVIYPHFTTATDTTNIQVVFQVVMDTIIQENLGALSPL